MFMAIVVGCFLADPTNCEIYTFPTHLQETEHECSSALIEIMRTAPFNNRFFVEAVCVQLEGLDHLKSDPI